MRLYFQKYEKKKKKKKRKRAAVVLPVGITVVKCPALILLLAIQSVRYIGNKPKPYKK